MKRKKTVIALDPFGKEYPVLTKDLQWRPSAYGIVIKDGKILLSKQFGNRYDLPGGGVELDETIEEAVIREVKEETGLDATIIKFTAVRENYFIWEEVEKYHSLLFYYVCKVTGGSLSTDGLEEYERDYTEMAEWVSLSEVDNILPASSVDFRPIIKQAVEDLK